MIIYSPCQPDRTRDGNDDDLFTASNKKMQKRYSQSNQVNTGPGVTLTL